jgi:ubiquitin carboxyl-terminal hydrolase 16
MFKTEYIDDFKCEKCRLLHAIATLESESQKVTSDTARANIRTAITRLHDVVETNPEHPPEDIVLPDMSYAPKRRIARHIRLTSFPKIMAIHLSRSIYDASNLSQKNSAKVAFPERLPLGGLLHQRKYKLLAVVTHKGSHYSGHYESFRRQSFYPPFSNPSTFQPSGVYSKSVSPSSTPTISALQQRSDDSSPLASTPDLLSPESVNGSSTPSLGSFASPSRDSPPPGEASPRTRRPGGPTSAPREKDGETASLKSVAASARSTLSRIASLPSSRSGSRNGSGRGTPTLAAAIAATAPVPPVMKANGGAAAPNGSKPPKRRKHNEKWWRISDEKVKEANTRDVLSMRREVYLLFYELERES